MPERVQLSRAKGWRMPPNTVKVARPSRYGNPHRIGADHSYYMEGAERATAAQCVELFRSHIEATCAVEPDYLERLRADLGGKNLACFCPLDRPCHADVLLELANPENGGGE
jgi:hypothetical protein